VSPPVTTASLIPIWLPYSWLQSLPFGYDLQSVALCAGVPLDEGISGKSPDEHSRMAPSVRGMYSSGLWGS
jgi:hypothetical protein